MDYKCFRLWLLVSCCLFAFDPLDTLAQISPETERRYKAAVKLVQLGDYERAKAELLPLTQRVNGLAPFAHYYYAIAAYRQRNFSQARAMLVQLAERFPDWRKADEASYLYGAASMEIGQYEEAMAALQRINNPELKPDITRLERFFFPKIKELNRLKALQREYPENKNLALVLIDRIQATSTNKADLELSDQLTNRFGDPALATEEVPVKPNRTTVPINNTPKKGNRPKGVYNVSVLFPFKLTESDRPGRSNQFVYDLYEGMKLAKAKLQTEGITINLLAYDLENDEDKTLELLNNPSFTQNTDLIFGPMYAEPNRLVTSFAMQSEIPLINPLATGRDLVAGQAFAYLAQPSLNQQAEKTAAYVQTLNAPRRAAIYYGNTRKDSSLAALYQAELKKKGYQIVEFRKVSGSADAMASAIRIGTTAMTSSSPTSAGPPASGNLPGHVFLASSNDNDGPHLLEALNRRRVTIPVIVTSSAFDFYQNSLSTFSRRDLYLLYPDFIDRSRPAVNEFESNFLNTQHIIPSVFAAQGYDMLLFFCRQLARNGFPVKNPLNLRSEGEDYLLSGFNYTQGNENQIVPIVKFDDGKFIKIN